jgi:perosamine synthetase
LISKIPVSEPSLGRQELQYATKAIKSGYISGTHARYVERFEEEFARYCNVEYGVAVTSGTTALHLAVVCLGVGPGDEVIVPAFTNIATALAVAYTGAKPIPVDCERDTFCMDPTQIERRISPRTKAIIPVHVYGHPADMNPILRIATRNSLRVIEDSAEAHGAIYMGRKVGSMSDVSCFSFYANKIITTGEGGMLLTNKRSIAQRARLLRNLAFTDRRRFLHEHIGFNYRMTNVQGAIGLAQLHRIAELVRAKRAFAKAYSERLTGNRRILLPAERSGCRNVYWMYGIRLARNARITRDKLMSKLDKRGIETRAFFLPMHKQPAFVNKGWYRHESHPVSEEIARTGLYLPSGYGLTEKSIETICETLEGLV